MPDDVEWGQFNLEKLFGNATRGKRLKSIDRIEGDLPFVTAGETNEGISAFIGNPVTIFSENTITIDMFGSAKYRNYKYGADDHVAVVHTEKLPRHAAIFVTSAIHKSSYTGMFDYGRNFYAKDADQLNITLPCTNGLPDYDYMESFIAQLEASYIAELEMYLSESGLIDNKLTEEEKKALEDYEFQEFCAFKVTDCFTVINSASILSRDIVENSGDTPYLCASRENNSVSSYISYDNKFLDKGNCVFIGGKTFVVTYQEEDFFSNDSHNLILYVKHDEKRTKLNQLFLAACIDKSLGHKYSWGDSVSNKKIQKDIISLPIQYWHPDYSFAETLMSAILKTIAVDLVKYIKNKQKPNEIAIKPD